jgi:Terminase DNA packaging enzyme
MSDKLANALGIENAVIVPDAKTEVMVPVQPDVRIPSEEDQLQDYVLSRNTFREIIRKGNQAIDGINTLAQQSESPRAYEVMATLMKTVADTTKDLYDLQKKTKDLKSDEKMRPQEEQRINVEKAVFVGSPSELLKQIKEQKNENST